MHRNNNTIGLWGVAWAGRGLPVSVQLGESSVLAPNLTGLLWDVVQVWLVMEGLGIGFITKQVLSNLTCLTPRIYNGRAKV